MGNPDARKAVVLELFAATGESIPEDDPIVTGAILFTHKLNEVAAFSAVQMREAGESAAAAVREASHNAAFLLNEAGLRCAAEAASVSERADVVAGAVSAQGVKFETERLQLAKAVEAQLARAVKLAGSAGSAPLSLRYLPAWYAVVGSVVVGTALAAAWIIGVEQGTARAEEAAVGRSFTRVLPELDPKVRAQIMEQLRKKAG